MSEAGLVAGSVVERFDVVKEDCPHLGSGELSDWSPDVADLVLDGRPERLHGGIVETVADAAVGTDEGPVVESVGELERCVLGWLP